MGTLRYHTVLRNSTHEMPIILVILSDGVRPLLSSPILGDLVKDIHFIVGCFDVVLGTFLHLQGNVAVEFEILGQPDSGEVSPTEFLDDYIPVKQDLSNMDGMVSTNLVIRHALVFARIFIFVEALIKDISQRRKVFILHVRKLVTMVSVAHVGRVVS